MQISTFRESNVRFALRTAEPQPPPRHHRKLNSAARNKVFSNYAFLEICRGRRWLVRSLTMIRVGSLTSLALQRLVDDITKLLVSNKASGSLSLEGLCVSAGYDLASPLDYSFNSLFSDINICWYCVFLPRLEKSGFHIQFSSVFVVLPLPGL